jgi:ribosomal protein S18 acetylase RimI-like enzyme
MPSYRTFLNVDPPALAAIWRSRAGQPGLMQPVSVDLLEQFIFGKVYFDYEGLILAFEEGRPVGFAHAAFGPNESCDRIATEKGVICMLMVRPDCAEAMVAEGLLERCEAYLRRRGAEVLYGGAVQPLCPFYLGLYGGSQLPGVLESDVVARDLYRSHGYGQIDRTHLFRRRLGDFRPPVDRRQIQLRRRMMVQMDVDPPFRSWWEACTTGDFDLIRFQVTRRGDPSVLASVTFRAMEATDSTRPGRAAGLLDLHVASSHRRQGLATFLLGESFRQLARQGVATIEAQASGHNPVGLGLCRKLGMKEVDRGAVFRKDPAPE